MTRADRRKDQDHTTTITVWRPSSSPLVDLPSMKSSFNHTTPRELALHLSQSLLILMLKVSRSSVIIIFESVNDKQTVYWVHSSPFTTLFSVCLQSCKTSIILESCTQSPRVVVSRSLQLSVCDVGVFSSSHFVHWPRLICLFPYPSHSSFPVSIHSESTSTDQLLSWHSESLSFFPLCLSILFVPAAGGGRLTMWLTQWVRERERDCKT